MIYIYIYRETVVDFVNAYRVYCILLNNKKLILFLIHLWQVSETINITLLIFSIQT